jgi:predicted nuclease of predicted toxin-antitoxin system
MTYFNFIKTTIQYLKSVRVIKEYISFDMMFPNTWTILKEHTKDIEVIKNNSQDDKVVVSFVSPYNEVSIDNIENSINSIVKYNIEREEKEKLFKSKVDELKNIFEKQKLDSLKNLKFDMDNFSLLTPENEEDDTGITERDTKDELREREKSQEPQQS